MSAWIRFALLALGLIILAGFVRSQNIAEITSSLSGADPGWLAVVAVILIANLMVKAVRWRVMAATLGARALPIPAASAAILAGVAAASLTPGRGVELAKPLLLRTSHGVPMASSTAAVVVERLLDGIALIVLFAVSLLWIPAARGSTFYPVLAAVALVLVVGAILLRLPHRLASGTTWVTDRLPMPAGMRSRVGSVVARFAGGLAVWRGSGRLGLLLSLSIAAACLEVVRLVAVFAALRLRLPVAGALLAFSAANLLATVTFIPGGIGITEVSLVNLVQLVAPVGPSAAVTGAVLADRALSYYLLVALGALILVAASRRTSPPGLQP